MNMGNKRCLRCIPLSHWAADRCAGRGKMPSGTWELPALAVFLRSGLWSPRITSTVSAVRSALTLPHERRPWSTGTAPPVPCVPCLRPSAQHSSSLPQVLGAPALRCTAATRQQEQAYRRHLSCFPQPAVLSRFSGSSRVPSISSVPFSIPTHNRHLASSCIPTVALTLCPSPALYHRAADKSTLSFCSPSSLSHSVDLGRHSAVWS
jgi:hypothetical protein